MEMIVSLSHEIRVDKKDVEQKPELTDSAQAAADEKERQRIKDTYGIDGTKQEIEAGENAIKKRNAELAEEKKMTIPADLGKFKTKEGSNAAQIQDAHDRLPPGNL